MPGDLDARSGDRQLAVAHDRGSHGFADWTPHQRTARRQEVRHRGQGCHRQGRGPSTAARHARRMDDDAGCPGGSETAFSARWPTQVAVVAATDVDERQALPTRWVSDGRGIVAKASTSAHWHAPDPAIRTQTRGFWPELHEPILRKVVTTEQIAEHAADSRPRTNRPTHRGNWPASSAAEADLPIPPYALGSAR